MIYRIKTMAAGGAGVGVAMPGGEAVDSAEIRARNRGPGIVFVPAVAPGDIVEVTRTHRVRGLDRALDWRLVEAGPNRVVPACPHSSMCGGCPWMQVSYQSQVEAKQGLLERALRQARLADQVAEHPLVVHPAADLFGYRRRARLFWDKRDGRVVLGFHAASSHELVDVTEPACPVLESSLAAVLEPISRFLETIVSMDARSSRGQVFLLAGSDGRVQVAFRAGGEHTRPVAWSWRDDSAVHELLEQDDALVGVGLWVGRQGWRWIGREYLRLDGTQELLGSAPGFSQANRAMDDLVRAEVVRLAGDGRSILELYAGSGNLTRSLARSDRRITAVESDAGAVACMDRSARKWPGRVEPVRFDAERFVRRALARKERFDLVVTDPPRKGLGKLARLISGLVPRRVIMVSCDPMTASRDLGVLVDAGFSLVAIRGFDTMPHTSHFELVALAERGQAGRSGTTPMD